MEKNELKNLINTLKEELNNITIRDLREHNFDLLADIKELQICLIDLQSLFRSNIKPFILKEPIKIKPNTIQDKILQILEDGAMTKKELQELLGSSYSSINQGIQTLMKEKRIVSFREKAGGTEPAVYKIK